ncbi:hypothetical protein RHMOL_Rhmol04G0201600 [Rhododendron molle]|uniref:Uncharacterized protein n=1 Tax=Rhododendron molle TaxID=49168 RepID=A0ACC0P481_RHOML|nr:hypothetical protein RHMOL_Rhmol04G0201600 [Rhododendron molle]
MAENSGNGGNGDVIDRSEDRGGPMVAETEDQTREGAVAGSGAVAATAVEISNKSNNGAGSGDVEPTGSPPRDPTKGKGAVVAEEETTENPVTYREEDVLFRPAATSSSHRPITKHDVAEHLPDEALAKLLEDNPMIGEIVLKAKEDRVRAIKASEAAERAERERRQEEELLRDAEAEERTEAAKGDSGDRGRGGDTP